MLGAYLQISATFDMLYILRAGACLHCALNIFLDHLVNDICLGNQISASLFQFYILQFLDIDTHLSDLTGDQLHLMPEMIFEKLLFSW